MRKTMIATILGVAVTAATVWAPAVHAAGKDLIEFEKMTWVEVKEALAADNAARRTPMAGTT
jgi:hypothetical protein